MGRVHTSLTLIELIFVHLHGLTQSLHRDDRVNGSTTRDASQERSICNFPPLLRSRFQLSHFILSKKKKKKLSRIKLTLDRNFFLKISEDQIERAFSREDLILLTIEREGERERDAFIHDYRGRIYHVLETDIHIYIYIYFAKTPDGPRDLGIGGGIYSTYVPPAGLRFSETTDTPRRYEGRRQRLVEDILNL